MGSCLGGCVSSSSSSPSSSKESYSSTSPASSTHRTFAAAAAAAASNSWLLWRHPQASRSACATDEQDAELISNASERCRHRGLVYRILKFKRKKRCPQFIDKYWDQQQQQQQQSPSYAKLQNESTNADIQLQNLDVFKLLNTTTPNKETELQSYTRIASSRASSSLDLEWEHEYAQLRQQQQYPQQQQLTMHTPPPMVNPQQHYTSLDQLTTTASLNASQVRLATRQQRAGIQRQGYFARTSCGSSTQNSWSHISTPESLEWDIDAEQEQQRQLRLEDDNLDDETLKLLHQIEQLKNHVLQETGDGLSTSAGLAAEELSEGLQLRATHFGVGSAATELEAHIS
ncbi:putative mediator of RNA polymerase II transcription subunit 26 [Scaptodrosophila lebanonensis]|uniref:Mediator of RNA polymerase II transcription subunit 26 n=1 Tax=Drosophila lebanonensis TaxID=7225 RepID=A0A6J2TNG3_DROLE|nr:putative mediator of RNA polymerase II transcription subunit 26 [Scaptodrosophila lebanonensis]